MRNRSRWIAVAALSVFACSTIAAQEATTTAASPAGAARSGFYISLGLAWGSADLSCSGTCSGSANKSGSAGYLGLGGTIDPQWRIGFESDAWAYDDQGYTYSLAFYNLMATYYPSTTSDFWLKAGLGYSVYAESGFGNSGSVNGFAGGLGLGFDWLPGHGKFAIIPYANYMYQFSGGDVSGTGSSIQGNLLQFGIGFGYRH